MPLQMAISVDSRQFDFLRELFMRINNPRQGELDQLERVVRVGFAQNFVRQGVGGGPSWLPLAPRTVQERRATGFRPTRPILRRTGRYSLSWTRPGGWRQLGREPAGWVLHVSSGHPWAFTHELGDRSRRVPPRPVRYLDSPAQRRIGTAVERWVDEIIRQVMT